MALQIPINLDQKRAEEELTALGYGFLYSFGLVNGIDTSRVEVFTKPDYNVVATTYGDTDGEAIVAALARLKGLAKTR